jgi:hypothetical protein
MGEPPLRAYLAIQMPNAILVKTRGGIPEMGKRMPKCGKKLAIYAIFSLDTVLARAYSPHMKHGKRNVTEYTEYQRKTKKLLREVAEYRKSHGLTWIDLAAEIKALSGVGGVSQSRLRLSCSGSNPSWFVSERIAGKIEAFLKRVNSNAA